MEFTLLALAALLPCSVLLNVYFYFQTKKLKKSPPPQQTYDATALLHDLTAGRAMVRVIRVDPTDVLLRSPRESA